MTWPRGHAGRTPVQNGSTVPESAVGTPQNSLGPHRATPAAPGVLGGTGTYMLQDKLRNKSGASSGSLFPSGIPAGLLRVASRTQERSSSRIHQWTLPDGAAEARLAEGPLASPGLTEVPGTHPGPPPISGPDQRFPPSEVRAECLELRLPRSPRTDRERTERGGQTAPADPVLSRGLAGPADSRVPLPAGLLHGSSLSPDVIRVRVTRTSRLRTAHGSRPPPGPQQVTGGEIQKRDL